MAQTAVENEFQKLEMAQAYKAITGALGPSHQLLSFVKYQTASPDNNFGLESLEIMGQHNEVVADIDAMDFTALESLIDAEAAEVDAEEIDFLQVSDELEQLHNIHDVVQKHGMSAGTLGILKTTNLLSTTAIGSIAIESLDGGDGSAMAMESIVGAIKDKATAYAAKLVSFIKKIGAVTLTPVVNRITKALSDLTTKVSDTAKNAGRTIKAHPYKSAVAALAGITAAAGLVAFVGNKLTTPDIKLDLVFKDFEEMAKRQYPNAGKDYSHLRVNIHKPELANYLGGSYFRRPIDINGNVETATLDQLGWTKAAVVSFSHEFTNTFAHVKHSIELFIRNASSFVTRGSFVGTEAINIPGTSKRESHQIITKLYWMVYRLVKTKIGGGYHHLAAMILRMLGH
jgi:hypothetical protein